MVDEARVLHLHPTYDGERFTLHGIYRDEGPALRKARKYRAEGYSVYAFRDKAPSGTELVFVARRQEVTRMPRAPLPQEHTADWEATRMAVSLFRRMERRAKAHEEPLAWYKDLEVNRLRKCLLSISWNGSHLDVASGMISDLITTHPFPNANHRTSLALGRLYLRSVDIKWPSYSLRGRGAGRFYRDTHDYYRDSKYLLRLLRSSEPLRIAYEEGFTHVRVGPETVAEIREADLGRTPEAIRTRHRRRTAMLIERLAGPRASDKLAEDNTRKLREWVDWYR